jgi:hypothetical protein
MSRAWFDWSRSSMVDKFPVVSDVLVEVTMTFGKGVNKLLVGGFRRVGEEEKERDKRAKEADLCSDLLRWKFSRQDGNRIPSTGSYVDVLVHRVCSSG